MALGWSEPTKTLSWFIQIYVIAFTTQKLGLELNCKKEAGGKKSISNVLSLSFIMLKLLDFYCCIQKLI